MFFILQSLWFLLAWSLITYFVLWPWSAGHVMIFLAVFSAYLVAGYVLSGKLER